MKQGILTEHDAFIMGAKETIIEMISGQPDAEKIANFVLKEADDNQIMSLLLVQEMPTVDNDYTLTEDYNTLVESDIINETEFYTHENYQMFVESIGGFVDNAEAIINECFVEMTVVTEAGEAAGEAALKSRIMAMLSKVGKKVTAIPGQIWSQAKRAYQAAIRAGRSSAEAVSKGASTAWTFIRNSYRSVKAGMRAGAARGFAKKGGAHAKAFGSKVSKSFRAGQAVGGAAKAVKGGVKAAGKAVGGAAQSAGKAAAGAARATGRAASSAASATKTGAMKAGSAVGGAARTAGKFVAGHIKPIGAVAGVALAAGASYKAYQKYFSAAAKACAGKSGAEKDACLKLARRKAV
jgi:hypothetical protein